MSEEKSNKGLTDTSLPDPTKVTFDKNKLFSKLFKVQYPMSQEPPPAADGPEDYSNLTYNEHMDALIKKYEDEL